MNDSDPRKSEGRSDKPYLAMLLILMLLSCVVFGLDWWGGGRVPSEVYSVIALAVVAVIILLIVRLARHRFQFSLRTLLLFVAVAGMGLGWLGSKVQPIRNEVNAVAEIQGMGGTVVYGLASGGLFDFETRLKRKTQFDQWLRGLLGAGPYGSANSVKLKDTGVTDADLATLKHLPDLELLTLGNTQVTDAGLVHLRNLANLQILNLESTQVTDAGMVHLKGLDEIRQLNVAGTEVTDQALEELQAALPMAGNLVSLKAATEIKMTVAEIERLGGSLVRHNLGVRPWGTPVVTSLYLYNLHTAHDIDALLKHAERLTRLRKLALSGSSVADAGLKHIKGLTSLSELDLSRTQITDAGLEHIKGLTSLSELDLSGTQVTDAGLEYIKGLTKLQTLCFRQTQLTDAGLEHLNGLTNLKSLDLRNTKVTELGVVKLQRALPNCEINR